ncbi:MAG: insulinase family protein, partial [Rufibacter sp.]
AREKPMGSVHLHTAKEQRMGQVAMAEESNMGFMMMMGKSILDLGTVESLNDIFAQIRAVQANDLLEIANDTLREDKLSFLQYVPS